MNTVADDSIEYGRSSFCRIIYAKRISGSLPAKEFISGLELRYRVKFVRLLDQMLQHGKISNTQKFKKLQGDSELWEFISKPYRLFVFQDGKTWVLANGFEKRTNRTSPREISRGKEIMKEYFDVLR